MIRSFFALAALTLTSFVRDAGALAQPSGPAAPPRKQGDVFFLGSRARSTHDNTPLAWVRGGEVCHADPKLATWPPNRLSSCGDPKRWAAVGSSWYALDGWGQIIGTSTVGDAHFYDATGCNELELDPAYSEETLYVSVDSDWRPSPTRAFVPPKELERSFRALARTSLDDRAVGSDAVHDECASIDEKVRFFTSRTGERYAVGTSNVGYMLAQLNGGRWAVKLKAKDFKRWDDYTCYRPVAVFDMNQDGIPEVVLRQSTGEVWGDFVLGRSGGDAKWRVVAISPGSAFV